MVHRIAALALALALSAACSTGHERAFVGGVTVHTFRRANANVHVVAAGRALLLVDSGYETQAPALDRAMRDEGLDPADVRAVVVTHGHADHAGGARWFQQRYGARVIAGRGDAAMLASGRNEPLCPTDLVGRLRRDTDQGAIYTPTRVDVSVDAPTPLAGITGITGTVVPLPGHTAGSLVVVLGEAAFVGDLFRGALAGGGAATHFYMCDLDDNRRDIDALLGELAPGARVFFTGHFGPVDREDVRALTAR